ncbi:MAG: cation transporter [Chthoniobacterales bacterium]|nr:MAG: cation transporter [Chthoniobacterales bacterium]
MSTECNHSHAPASFTRAFAVGVALNTAYIGFEVGYGIIAHSLALIADAGHNLSDVLGLLLAWAASAMARTRPTKRRTYGLRGSSILAALFNAILLLISVGAIAWEAIQRLGTPPLVSGKIVIGVSAVGILINTITAWMFAAGRKGDLNIRSAFLHMAADAAISAGVVLAGIAIVFTGQRWIDPLVSLAISAIIVWGTWDLLREAVNLALQAVPRQINPDAVQQYLRALPGIAEVHDLHIWPMSTTETAITAHLIKPDGSIDDALLCRVKEELHTRFAISHVTIQCECGDSAYPCEQEPEHIV